jgi:alpha-ketoglutarate-dependent taurine dioxygenase
MKVSKIPGLGRFGIFIDDVDFNSMSDDQWMEIGHLHLNSLVTIIRDTKLNQDDYAKWMRKWGSTRALSFYRLAKKYGTGVYDLFRKYYNNDKILSDEDREYLRKIVNIIPGDAKEILRISGKKDKNGDPIGMFAEGELLWHSNESGNIAFTPAVSLLGSENMIGSSTGFATTADWYESQSESFRSELDEMVIVHNFTPGKINPGLRADQDELMYRNMCPVDGTEIPLIRRSPGGIKGVHYSQNTISHIKGMSKEESQKIFKRIEDGIFSEDNIYDHWYQSDSDLCLFDNSITQHRRLGDVSGRMAYRIQFAYTKLLDQPYQPYFQEPFQSQYSDEISQVNQAFAWLDNASN